MTGITCDCMEEFWSNWTDCPFYLECLDSFGYVAYCTLVRDVNGKIIGYYNVMEKF